MSLPVTMKKGTTEVTEFEFKQGEADTITFTISTTLSLTGVEFSFGLRALHGTTILFERTDDEFDKTELASKKVSLFLTADNTNQAKGRYMGELKMVWPDDPVGKTADIPITIGQSATSSP